MWLFCIDLALAEPQPPAPESQEHGSHEPHGHEPHGHDATVQHRFDDPARWSAVFDDPARDAWQKPAELIAALPIAPGQTAADIGAGTGYFEAHLARAVGPDGSVIAIDIEPSLVAHIAQRAVDEQTPQVSARLGAPHDPGLGKREADLVLIVDTYHHIDDRITYFRALRKAVDKRGALVIVDFRADQDLPVGPPREHRLSAERVKEELAQAGWTFETSRDDLLPYQYVLIFRR